MSGGVRNLRAMFETGNQAPSTSPPDRGRSAESTGTTGNGSSPRPLSKVRTSFVTVERSGQQGSQLGLRRDNSQSSTSNRRTSFSDLPLAVLGGNKLDQTGVVDSKKSSTVSDKVPEAIIENEETGDNSKGRQKERGREPARDKVDEKPVAVRSGDVKALPKHERNIPSDKSKSTPAPAATAKGNAQTPVKMSPKKVKTPAIETSLTPKAIKIKNAKSNGEKPPNKVPTINQVTKSASRASLVQASSPKTRIGASPPQTGFVKPRPRSPTKPIKLPASLTAHTASSGSKTTTTPSQPAPGRQSVSRSSISSQNTKTSQPQSSVSRSPSRTNRGAAAGSSLAGKSSISNKGSSTRPSLGPPPLQLKKQPSRQGLPAPADDTFLARMMRSTASSASKIADKSPITPPKKTSSNKSPAKNGVIKADSKRPEVHVSPLTQNALISRNESSMASSASRPTTDTVRDGEVAKAAYSEKDTKLDLENEASHMVKPLDNFHNEDAGSDVDSTQTFKTHDTALEDAKAAELKLSSIAENRDDNSPLLPRVLEAEAPAPGREKTLDAQEVIEGTETLSESRIASAEVVTIVDGNQSERLKAKSEEDKQPDPVMESDQLDATLTATAKETLPDVADDASSLADTAVLKREGEDPEAIETHEEILGLNATAPRSEAVATELNGEADGV